ncbi:hypothetical protein GCM10010430_28570 [Kitasatospora cystarginea]|uniref:Uncharacterized protein n=1 Tax=Kitasatospora cystarginea TaxID=58350 RepID=A0ABP5QUU1_9ACTN
MHVVHETIYQALHGDLVALVPCEGPGSPMVSAWRQARLQLLGQAVGVEGMLVLAGGAG